MLGWFSLESSSPYQDCQKPSKKLWDLSQWCPLPNDPWSWFRRRRKSRGWIKICCPFSEESKENHLGCNNFHVLQKSEIFQETMLYQVRALSHMLNLGETWIIPQCGSRGQLHNWRSNQYLGECQPKALLTPLSVVLNHLQTPWLDDSLIFGVMTIRCWPRNES